jgi:hypothetical protein
MGETACDTAEFMSGPGWFASFKHRINMKNFHHLVKLQVVIRRQQKNFLRHWQELLEDLD